MQLRKLIYFFRLPIFVFVFHLFLGFFGLYDLYPWIDIPLHFFGGVVVAYSFVLVLNFLQDKNLVNIKDKLNRLIVIVALVALIAVFWEFGEFILDYFFNLSLQESLEDTMLDLFLGLVGGFVVGLFKN